MADLDLDAIERHVRACSCTCCRDVRALLAEVRRLRAAVVYAPVVGVATDGPRPTEGGDAA